MISIFIITNFNDKQINLTKESLLNGSNNNLFDINVISSNELDIIKNSKHDWMLFVRSGTTFYKESIDRIASYITKYRFIPLFYGGFDVLKNNQNKTFLPFSYDAKILQQINLVGPIYCIQKKLFNSIKEWDFNKEHEYFKTFAQQEMFMSIPHILGCINEN